MSIQNLVQVPDSDRDSSWENKFFQEISQSKIQLLFDEPKTGPDGWPYLLAQTTTSRSHEADQKADHEPEPFQQILRWLATRGIGLVINPNKEYPDFVFTYGMIWYFLETGLFYSQAPKVSGGQFEYKIGPGFKVGQPTEKYLPLFVRKVIKQFFLDQGVLRPRICVISTDDTHFDLALSVESIGNPAKAEHESIAEAVSWFLPPHYSVVLLSEVNRPGFADL